MGLYPGLYILPLPNMAEACEERERLIGQFRTTLRAYAEAVKSLEGISQADFEHSYQAAQAALAIFITARAHLNYHLASHGCNDENEVT